LTELNECSTKVLSLFSAVEPIICKINKERRNLKINDKKIYEKEIYGIKYHTIR